MTENWDKTPWMVGGNVQHSTNVARLLAYAAFAGQEGIINPLDLEVRERVVPAGSVRVNPGACSILNRNPNVAYEAYADRLPIEDYVDIAPTGSGSGRTDLVIARVENPFLTGEPYTEPTVQQIADGDYRFMFTRVLPSMVGPAPGAHPTLAQVKAAIADQSAIALASVALPANTGTVEQGFIKDWRRIAQFREAQVMRVVNPTATVLVDSSTFKTIGEVPVDVPDWATHFTARTVYNGFFNGTAAGGTRLQLGSVTTETTNFNESEDTAGGDLATLIAGDGEVPIPTAIRGTSQTFRAQARLTGGSEVKVHGNTVVSLDLVFHSLPEHNTT